MKVGSYVECVDDCFREDQFEHLKCVPIKGNIYVIRGIMVHRPGDIGVVLEEIINPPYLFSNGMIREPHFKISRFREVLTPPDLMDEIKEILELGIAA